MVALVTRPRTVNRPLVGASLLHLAALAGSLVIPWNNCAA
jgi:hypothetical protein